MKLLMIKIYKNCNGFSPDIMGNFQLLQPQTSTTKRFSLDNQGIFWGKSAWVQF